VNIWVCDKGLISLFRPSLAAGKGNPVGLDADLRSPDLAGWLDYTFYPSPITSANLFNVAMKF